MKQVSCSCGYIASADTAEELLTAVEAHIDANHGLSGADAPQPTPQEQRVASLVAEERATPEIAFPATVAHDRMKDERCS